MNATAAAASGPSGLAVIVDERGRISKSIDAAGTLSGSSSVTVNKPAGATVRRAVLLAASTGFSGQLQGAVSLNGSTVALGHATASAIQSFNYWTDVTSLVKPTIDAAGAGALQLPVIEENTASVDGVILAVIFNDPAQTRDRSVTLLFGATQTTGDHFQLQMSKPLDPSSAGAVLEMSLGISFGYQTGGVQQYSQVDVNGSRLTTSAGGEDDGEPGNGALITVGGVGDSTANPSPFSTPTGPRSDDELYNLLPFVHAGATTVDVNTLNPSNDDNILFAAFTSDPPVTRVVTPVPSNEPFRYVALGDSYSSGEGAINESNDASFSKGTDTKTDKCHRSANAYPWLLKTALGVADKDFTFAACSGAFVVEFVHGFPKDGSWNEKPQLDAIAPQGKTDPRVGLVTLSVGGNDAGFVNDITECTTGFGTVTIPALSLGHTTKHCGDIINANLTTSLNHLTNNLQLLYPDNDAGNGMFVRTVPLSTLPKEMQLPVVNSYSRLINVPSLAGLYQEISRRAPNARIVVMAYPKIFPSHMDSKCVVGTFEGRYHNSEYKIDSASMNLLDAAERKLNTTIKDQVEIAKTRGVKKIDYVDTYGAFENHGPCDTAINNTQFINGVMFVEGKNLSASALSPFSFHPNEAGQADFARQLLPHAQR